MTGLSVEQIIRLHQKMIYATGGSSGLRDEGTLISAVQNAYSTFDGKDLYPTLVDKASIICFCLIANHPFVDGNKRIGIYVMLILLELNGVTLVYEQDELIKLGLGIAQGKLKNIQISNWIHEHIQSE